MPIVAISKLNMNNFRSCKLNKKPTQGSVPMGMRIRFQKCVEKPESLKTGIAAIHGKNEISYIKTI